MRYRSIFPAFVSGSLVTALMMSQSLAQNDSAPALLAEFRPIGGSGNNLRNPGLDAVPGNPELALAPLSFANGPDDGLVGGPNARAISNVIAGGTGGNGADAETTDPRASAWVYVFGHTGQWSGD
jgi:hypothetical protein